MATTTRVSYSVVDEEPDGYGAVGASLKPDVDDTLTIELVQDDDTIAMRVEHAAAVHAALGQMIEHARGLG